MFKNIKLTIRELTYIRRNKNTGLFISLLFSKEESFFYTSGWLSLKEIKENIKKRLKLETSQKFSYKKNDTFLILSLDSLLKPINERELTFNDMRKVACCCLNKKLLKIGGEK